MKQGEERLDSGKIIYYTCTFYGVLDGKRHRGRIKRSDFANLRALPHNSCLNELGSYDVPPSYWSMLDERVFGILSS